MKRFPAIAIVLASIFLVGCRQLNDERIPSYAVNIDLSNPGVWTVYGVHTYGQYNQFIITKGLPAGFAYKYGSATGFGGVLLICGQSGFTGDVVPLAYDLSCPVECLPEVRVFVDPNELVAICPDCGSVYNVTEGGGAPLSGPAVAMHYGLRPYQCFPTTTGGYVVSN